MYIAPTKFDASESVHLTLDKEHDYIMSEHTGSEFSNLNAKQSTKTKAEKTFEELVEESLRLPELNPSSHLPLSMTEILRNSQKSKDVSTKLPQIHSGKVQLVNRSDGLSGEKKRRRRKKAKINRPERPSPHIPSDNSSSALRVTCAKPSVGLADTNHITATANTEQGPWKKKMHRRQNKRRMAEDSEAMNVSLTIATYHHF